MWSITTTPARRAAARWRVFLRNLAALRALIARSRGRLAEVRTAAGYRAARARGAHACLLAIQGLNAVEAAPEGVLSLPDDGVVRATLVHLTDAVYGATSSPLGAGRRDKDLTAAGREAIAQLNARRIFVDLAHIHERGFWGAVAVHDRSQPLRDPHRRRRRPAALAQPDGRADQGRGRHGWNDRHHLQRAVPAPPARTARRLAWSSST